MSGGTVPAFLLDMEDQDLRDFARKRARTCQFLAPGREDADRYRALRAQAENIGVEPPCPGTGGITLSGAVARMEDEDWWRRVLRRATGRERERRARAEGKVHKFAGTYVSDNTLHRRRRRRQANRELMACMEAINELGDSFTLEQLADRSMANPHIRRSELMARIAGFEHMAKDLGHVAAFYTITCSSRMHCRRALDGKPVPNDDGTTPHEAQVYLRTLWSRARAKLHRQGLGIYGLRVAEPNHDGTPHWHLLLFMEPNHQQQVSEVLTEYALQVDGDEPGAESHRIKAEPIDWTRGSAAGYVAKYVSKNVDGAHIGEDVDGTDARHAAERIEAWARVWGIRQFQQIGGPPVSAWRELRRLEDAEDELIDQARTYADQGDWAEFTRLMGGPTARRSAMPVTVAKTWSDEPGRYGEPKGYEVFGVRTYEVTVCTRKHVWRIERGGGAGREAALGPPARRAAAGGDSPSAGGG